MSGASAKRLAYGVLILAACFSVPHVAIAQPAEPQTSIAPIADPDGGCGKVIGEAQQQRCRADNERLKKEGARLDAEREAAWQKVRNENAALEAEQKQRAADQAAADVAAKKAFEEAVAAKRQEDDADEYKRVDALDLMVLPERYIGKKIKVDRMQCLAAGPSDYRCVANSAELAVSSEVIEPAETQDRIDDRCATVRAAFSSQCRRTLRFVVDSYKNDVNDGRDRTVVITSSILMR